MGLKSLLTTTPKSRRNYKAAAVAGLVGGVFSAIVKFGWEVPFPPRTPERNATNPPQELLEQLGMSPEASHTTVTFNGNELPIYSFAIHFSFAIFFALAYCLIAEKYPKAKLWQGGCVRLDFVGSVSRRPDAGYGHCPRALGPAFRRALFRGSRPRRVDVGHRDCEARLAQQNYAHARSRSAS